MRAFAIAVAATLAAGCGAGGTETTGPVYPGELQPPTAFAEDFLLQQQLQVELEGAEPQRFRAALQRRGDSLVLIGLTPMGTRAFVIEQRGLEVSFTSHMPEDRDLAFPPRFILLDVQRALLPALSATALEDGTHRGEVRGEDVVERWEGGRLHERRFSRRAGRPAGEIVVTYEGGMAPGAEPPNLVLDNGWLGYRLVITTLSYQQL